MKRRTGILILAAVALLCAAAAGTLAYFTASGTAVNVISTGNVRMQLHDELPDGTAFPQGGLDDLMPGDTADKIVYVENAGDNAFYARIRLQNAVTSAEGGVLNADKLRLNIDAVNWELRPDGWYYYRFAVPKGAATAPLFTQVTFAPDMGNAYMDAQARIEVVAQAVQQANNGAAAWQASGWPTTP